jgi:hypothetical protein
VIKIVQNFLLPDNPFLVGMKIKGKMNIKKGQRGPRHEIRLIYQYFGTIEGIVHMIGLHQCDGHIELELKDGRLRKEGFLVANDAITRFAVEELVNEIEFILQRLMKDFKNSDITLSIVHRQGPEICEDSQLKIA